MKRSVELLGGGVLGLILGTVFLAEPVVSAFAPAVRATWSVSGCPFGTYMLSSTAQLIGGGPIYTANTPVRVPQADVVQLFKDLAPGQYVVSAILRASNGSVTGSATQTLMAEEGAGILRSRAPEQEPRGMAGPRRPPASPPLVTPASINTTVAPPSAEPARTVANGRAAPRIAAPDAAMPREWQISDLIQMIDPAGAESGWHRITVVDLDDDGLADEIRIESPSGATIVWRLVPSRVSAR